MDSIINIAKEMNRLAERIYNLSTWPKKPNEFSPELDFACSKLYLAVTNYNGFKKPNVDTRDK